MISESPSESSSAISNNSSTSILSNSEFETLSPMVLSSLLASVGALCTAETAATSKDDALFGDPEYLSTIFAKPGSSPSADNTDVTGLLVPPFSLLLDVVLARLLRCGVPTAGEGDGTDDDIDEE